MTSVDFFSSGSDSWYYLCQLKVATEELKHILDKVNAYILPTTENPSPLKTIAGGSVANTIRGLAAGFGIQCGIIGAYGNDQQGKLFVSNMSSYKVDISRLRLKNGHTAQCVCLVDEHGNRTMRPCLSSAVKVQADELKREDFKGSKWLVLRYAILNFDVINAAVRIAKQEGLCISLDLASFEVTPCSDSMLDVMVAGVCGLGGGGGGGGGLSIIS
nr:uncharacterized sugar kinase slr0537-like [Ipomoea batatas]